METEQKKKVELDKEKASYLFDKKEIEEIEKDLNEAAENPYDLDCSGEFPAPTKEKDEKLFRVMSSLPKEDGLLTAELTIKREKGVHLQELDKQKDEARKRSVQEVKSIEKGLANQKGLSKLWAINEKFGTDLEANINEEDAFNKAVKSPVEPDGSFYRKLRNKTLDVRDPAFSMVCPRCSGKKKLNILGLKIKCFKCSGLGSVLVDGKTFYKSLGDRGKPLSWRQQYWKEQHEKVGFYTIDAGTAGTHVHPDFYEN
jgi:hypothetical protein